jgi:hypothetical protein
MGWYIQRSACWRRPKGEILKLKAQLRRTEGERDILEQAAFIQEHRYAFDIAVMCRVLRAVS